MKILITGASGLLGSALVAHLSDEFEIIGISRNHGSSPYSVRWVRLDLLDLEATRELIIKVKPDIVIHCAALVDVDACQKNFQLADKLHRSSTAIMAETISEWKGRLIYISTDSVFNGQKSSLYIEQDLPDPLNVYAKTKYGGEQAALLSDRAVILRTNIFGWSRTERLSFAEWVLKGLVAGIPLTMFTDVRYTPIHVSHFSQIIRKILHIPELKGIYHATGSESLTKYDFAIIMADIFDLKMDNIIPASVDDLGLTADRPRNMALSNHCLSAILEFSIPGAKAGIQLMKHQCDTGWVSRLKGCPTKSSHPFWEILKTS